MIVIKLFLNYNPDHLNFKTFSKKLTHYLGNENYRSKEINIYIFFSNLPWMMNSLCNSYTNDQYRVVHFKLAIKEGILMAIG